jgi:predicted TIM-barrel fold metal-dependent hydrolase
MESVRAIRRAKDEQDLAAVTFFPAGCLPQVPVDDPKAYAVYATCVELDIPVVVNAGIAASSHSAARRIGTCGLTAWAIVAVSACSARPSASHHPRASCVK